MVLAGAIADHNNLLCGARNSTASSGASSIDKAVASADVRAVSDVAVFELLVSASVLTGSLLCFHSGSERSLIGLRNKASHL